MISIYSGMAPTPQARQQLALASTLELCDDEQLPTTLLAQLGTGRLIELSGDAARTQSGAPARTSMAARIIHNAQVSGETAAWVQPHGGPLYPPDLAACGIDLHAMIVVHVPAPAHPLQLCKATELLLRSGAWGLVVVDFCAGAPHPGQCAWQGRLLGLARQHRSHVVLLTEKADHADSLGPLIGTRLAPRRTGSLADSCAISANLLKHKSAARLHIPSEPRRPPWGMRNG